MFDAPSRVMLREFARYVRDDARTAAFETALQRIIRPGDVVLDLGSGFGLLSMLAARIGAAHVIAVEQLPAIAALAEATIRDNGLQDRITVVAANSKLLDLAGRVDVIVAELIGPFGVEEYIGAYVADARTRFLRAGGACIPRAMELRAAPAELPALYRARQPTAEPWSVHGIDLHRLQVACRDGDAGSLVGWSWSAEDQLVARAHRIRREEFDRPGSGEPSAFSVEREFEIVRDGRVDALVGWLHLDLGSGVELSTAPSAPPTHWGQVAFPAAPAFPVRAGDRIACRLEFDHRTWRCALSR